MAEEERLARVRIEAGLAGRRLTPAQASKLITTLVMARGMMPAVMVTLLGEREAHEYGLELVHAIQSAGVRVGCHEAGSISPPIYGLLITGAALSPIKAAFDAAGLVQAQYTKTADVIPSILVGLKPPSF